MHKQLLETLQAFCLDNDVSMEVAVACATADLRHICDEEAVDYGHADSLGYSHYCEENGQRQRG